VSHDRPAENIPRTILEFAPILIGLDHSLDETVDIFAPIAKLSPISCSPSRASLETASGRVESESRLHAGKPKVFDSDLSCNN